MGKRPRSRSPAGIQPTAMKALRAQGVSLEVIAGASQLDVAEVERILEQEEPGAQERVVLGWKHRNPHKKAARPNWAKALPCAKAIFIKSHSTTRVERSIRILYLDLALARRPTAAERLTTKRS